MAFAKVIVVNPPNPPGYAANRDSMGGYGQLYPIGAPVMPPLDIPYLIAYLADKGVALEAIESQGLDLTLEQLANRVAGLANENAPGRTLAVVRTALPSLDWDLSVCTALKGAAPGSKLAIYGSIVPHVLHRVYQEPALDYVLRGEPDETVYELAAGTPEADVLGLNYRLAGSWTENPPRPFLKELDRLPFPKWELLPYKRYTLPRSSTTAVVPFLPMLTSRGCPYGCHYCPYPVGQGLPWRFRSPK